MFVLASWKTDLKLQIALSLKTRFFLASYFSSMLYTNTKIQGESLPMDWTPLRSAADKACSGETEGARPSRSFILQVDRQDTCQSWLVTKVH